MPTLAAITRTLLSEARQMRGVAHPKVLPRGLTIAVRVEADDTIQLKLERSGVTPSLAEWQKVIQHWPEGSAPASDVKPNPYKTGHRYALVGRWKPAQSQFI